MSEKDACEDPRRRDASPMEAQLYDQLKELNDRVKSLEQTFISTAIEQSEAIENNDRHIEIKEWRQGVHRKMYEDLKFELNAIKRYVGLGVAD